MPVLAVFVLGAVVGALLLTYVQAHPRTPVPFGGVVPTTTGPTITVPSDAVDPSTGLAQVICEPYPGAAGYSFSARAGTTVRCSNGAAPSFGP